MGRKLSRNVWKTRSSNRQNAPSEDRSVGSASKTYRATFGGALASRELWFGRSGSDRYLSLLSGLVTRVSGRIPFGASSPIESMAREASTLSLETCHAGFSRRGIDPVGETSNVPDTPLGSRRLVVSTPASANRRHPWSSQTKSPRSQPSPRRQAKPKTPAKPRKSRERSLPVPVPASAAGLSVINPDAAGIDVHSNMHMVCVPADRDANPVRQFGANTADLQEIVAWLKKCRIKTVALESTGVYWIPLFELLESEGFEVNPVEPGQLSRCGARPKTDVLDAQWIQRLHSYGLLRASFRPPDSVLALRAYWRQRQMQVRYAAYHVQHMQKAMEQMNVKLPEVVSDITGVTGMLIIGAILEGERDPVKLAQLRDERCQHSEEQIALALEGTWRPEHLFELRQD